MLHNLWIAKDTGECLFHRKYGSIEHDENLITSFLSAIQIFAQNVDEGCDFLQTTSYKFIYTCGENTVTVACIDNGDDESTIRNEIDSIQDEFLQRFSKQLEEWNGRVEIFSEIGDLVDERLEKYRSPIVNLKDSKLELNPSLRKKDMLMKYSTHQEKVISLLKYRGSATINEIVKHMKLSESDAEKAAKGLLYNNVIRKAVKS
ncbi:MAG: hypothetical protein ACXABK_00295 [Candidatus Heimdallarchaeaceae archaeon]|jgi:hypothetical protein